MYVHLTDGIIDYGPGNLPISWADSDGNTHSLPAMTDSERFVLNWLIYVERRTPLTPHYKWGAPVYTFEGESLIATFPSVAMTPEEAAAADTNQWTMVRDDRNGRLLMSDWVGIRAYETTEPYPQDWKDYRQALRDITAQSDPYNITWPVEPPQPTRTK